MSAEIDSLDCLNLTILNSYIELEPGVKDFSFINELVNLFASVNPPEVLQFGLMNPF